MKTEAKIEAAKAILASKDAAYICRLMAGDSGNHPVVIVVGKQAPKQVGQSYGWEKVSGPCAGERVSKAYAKKYWRNVQYVGSTIQIEVGADWLLSSRNRPARRTDDGVTMLTLPGRTVRVGTVRIIPGWINGERSYPHGDRVNMSELRAHASDMAAKAITAWALQDDHTKLSRIFQRDLTTTRVTLEDSRCAGNCIEGSLQFAERKLGMSRAEVVASGYLLGLPASRILAVANGQTEPAKRACYTAWLRETIVSI